jgi:hypothetical protein
VRWLRQQARVEALAAGLQRNRQSLSSLADNISRRVHHRLRQPSTLGWAFGAGVLSGLSRQGRRYPPSSAGLLPIFNSALALWSLLAKLQSRSN